MKNRLHFLHILLLIFTVFLIITSCADRDAVPAAVVYTRTLDVEIPNDETTTIEIETESKLTIDPLETEPETEIEEVTTEEESVASPLTVLPDVKNEPELYSSVGEIPVILNINSGTYHLDSECTYVKQTLDENKRSFGVDDLSALAMYKPCSRCGTLIETAPMETAPMETAPMETEPPIVAEVIETQSYEANGITAIVNLNTKTFHTDYNCRHIKNMSEENKSEYTGTIEDLKANGYKACGTCSKQYKD